MAPEAKRPEDVRRNWRPTALVRLGLYFALVFALAVVAVNLGYDGTVQNAERWVGANGTATSGTSMTAPPGKPDNVPNKSDMLSEVQNTADTRSVRLALQELLIAAITAIAFAIPVGITYSLTRRKEGYERAVVQMLMILPVLVAGIVLVVKGSLALAFTLAGIVAVVRFRATFRDVKDAVFGCAAIGIGLAAGIHSIVIAGGMSFIFCALAIILWKMDVGDLRKDLARMEGEMALADALVPVGHGETLVRGNANGANMNGTSDELAEEAARLERIIQSDAEAHKKKARFTHLLLVHTNKVKSTRESVEELLEGSAKRWRFISEVPYNNGTRTLEFLARLRPSANESRLLSSIQGQKEVVGVEMKAVGALREAVTAS
jgi:hypothetical protein